MASIGQARIEFYWEDHYSSYAEAKECGGVRTVTHDYLNDGMHLTLRSGIAADIREYVMLGAKMVDSGANVVFFLFDYNGNFVDSI